MADHDDLLERHRRVLPDWMALYYDRPIALVDGDGCRVRDAEGNEYLDFFGGILTTSTGHGNPAVVDAIREQAGRLLHTSTLYLIEQQIELAETIAELSPISDARVFFTNSGTEANDLALLLATSYRGSDQVLAMRNSYHGRSFASVAITGMRSWSPSSLTPVSVSYVHGSYKLRSPWRDRSDAEYVEAAVADLEDVLSMTAAGTVACLIAEPIQGVGGFATPPDGLYGALGEVLDRHGILLVADEVQTGWGRTGEHFWGIEAHGVVPDVMTFAKGVANGVAMGGVVARADVMNCLGANSISTFGGNPVASAAALANVRYILDNDLQSNAREMGRRLRDRLDAIAEQSDAIVEVRGKGLMQAVEIVVPGGLVPDTAAAARVMEDARAAGLIIGRGGSLGNVLRVAPPLCVTAEEVDEAGRILEEIFAQQG